MADGLEVICLGHLDVYAPRGSYQLIVDEIEPKGMGALELALRQLREKLAREGLFDPGRKRPLPPLARRIGLVTSPTGAAIHDFLQVLGRRWRGADVLVFPVRVQGEGAAEEIAAAIATANRLPLPIDCLVVARGGGSLEDLWAFNEEVVVRAIFASRIPVVSAVGHEIDVTLSDLVADVRALTPSEAAELVAPAAEELIARLRQIEQRAGAAMRFRLSSGRARVEAIARSRVFRRPLQRIEELARRLDELEDLGRPGGPRPAGACRPSARRHRGPAGIAQSVGRVGSRLQSDPPDGRRPFDSQRERIDRGRADHDAIFPRRGDQPRGGDSAVIGLYGRLLDGTIR